jgi:hypothetical protein
MNAIAKTGVARFRMGMETNAAMNIPAVKR